MLRGHPHPRGLSWDPPESSGILGLTREGRKESVGANSPDTGEKSCCCFCHSPAPVATISVSCQGAAQLPWWYLWDSCYFSTSPSPLCERVWEPWRHAWSGGLWDPAFWVWEHQNLRGCGQHYSHCSFCTLKPLDTVDPYNQAFREFSVSASRNRIYVLWPLNRNNWQLKT